MAEIGSTLREARMRERIDVTTVEAATKIRAKYLRALENEEWDQLPGPTFVRTFLRTYGDYLGLDSKMLVEEYKQRFERPAPQDLAPFSSRGGGGGGGGGSGGRRPRQPRGIPPWAVVAACVGLLLVALFALGALGGDSGPSNEQVATSTPSKGGSAAQKAKQRKARERQRARERKRKQAAAAQTVVSLQIVPEAEVNVCLVNIAGDPLIRSENLTQPTETFRSRRMRVTFGNGLVRMVIDGKSFDVPDTSTATGFELLPGKDPEPLPSDELPTCA